jgi:hypothetical protein
MEELLNEYFLKKRELDHRTKDLEKLRMKIKSYLKEQNLFKFENKSFQVSLLKGNRTSLQKKDVPKDIWEQYSVCTPYESIYIKEKKQQSRKSKL